MALRYVARGVAESDEAAIPIFDTLTDLCREQLSELQRRGMLRSDLDLEWAALHTVLINLGTVIMEHRVLPVSCVGRFSPSERWTVEGGHDDAVRDR